MTVLVDTESQVLTLMEVFYLEFKLKPFLQGVWYVLNKQRVF